ncbi:tripartite ATP-independent transporter DctP family solute receptor [Sedimentibacter acidaminivorans]|uniref:Tripartite ATP-independent transporter DctP family solute receptor n=1 Tax=Sedimentibacter acidaminivorans TaxID=913099 RepID=A0ABS4GC93_9FIRM|nr:TRAP transporter substrate-binding protein [Sedimentibacter acidaminivorans]MBP1925284.1 tripartite ATP-independent transporter DctP family solute receptor [Sedimentibacter acidaminivorans]
MYYWDYIYSRDKNCIISLDTSPKKFNKMPKGYLDIKIFTSDGTPIKNAYIKISAPDEFNEFIININALGYYPTKINNVQFRPGSLCTLNVNLNPIPLKNQVLNHDQIINLPKYESVQNIQNILELQQDEVRNLSFSLGVDSPEDTLIYLYAKKFTDEVYRLSDGKIKIEIFTDAKLGADREMIKSIIQDGYPDFIVQTTAPQVDFVPKLSVFDMPMVYSDVNNLRNTIRNDVFFQKISNAYSDSGYKLLGLSDILFRQMTSNKPIQNIDDFNEIKIRTIQNPNHIAFWESLGATVIPLPVSEIYPSLKFGYIDSEENSYEVIAGFKLYEVQDYLINTKHLPHIISLITSNNLYNSLSTAEKAIIDEAATIATLYTCRMAIERFEEREQILIDNGMTIIDLPEETKQAMKSAALPLYEKIREIIGDDALVDTYFQNSNFI